MELELHEDVDLLRYGDMDDKDIIRMARDGNSVALEHIINRYRHYVVSKTKTYFLVGADRDDIIQEGMIGLFKAIRDYDIDKPASFRYFAELCITRQIITAIKTATRKKHIPLNSYVSLDRPIYMEESERTLLDMIEGFESSDPVEEFMIRENMTQIKLKIYGVLSELETEVLKAYMKGKTYREIGDELSRDKKCIDNALQRIKRKVERSFGNLFVKFY